VTVTEQEWEQTLQEVSLGVQPEWWSLVAAGTAPSGAGTAKVLGLPVPPDLDADGWSELAQAAFDRLEPGGYLVLRTPAGATPVEPPSQAEPRWIERFQRLIAAGFTIHRSGTGWASFRRDRAGVLYLAPWLTFGGSDRGTLDWLRHLPGSQFRRYLHTTQPSANELFAASEELADEAWCLSELMPVSAMAQFIVNFLATRNVDVLHIMNSRLGFDLLPTLKSAFPHLRTVVQLHVEEEDRSGYCRYVTTRYGNLVDAFSVTSVDLAEKLRRYHVSPSRLNVIYTGLDTDEFAPDGAGPRLPASPNPSGGLDILFPARLTAQKDPFLMVKVAAALRDAGSSAVIHVVGDGELRGEVEAAVGVAGLVDRVLFHGSAHDMRPWFRGTDVTLLTSAFEGLPFVIFEALGMGRPVVVPDLGGTREVVDGEVGFLIEDRGQVQPYTNALLALEKDPRRREALGKAGRRRVMERFTVTQMASDHARLYHSLAAQYAVSGLIS
jgi:glycosyltransferase involved in cell wall biosynthesis